MGRCSEATSEPILGMAFKLSSAAPSCTVLLQAKVTKSAGPFDKTG